MKYHFYKYQGTGNDFILFDRRKQPVNLSNGQIHQLCDRRFGIGADGVIILDNAVTADFKMVYFNADGNESSMCGNGGRCIAQYAFNQQYVTKETIFEAVDGNHRAYINSINPTEISLLMNDVEQLEITDEYVCLDTGSPHYVTFVNNIEAVNVLIEGRLIRNTNRFEKTGINVNFVEIRNDELHIRTYERGVEDETLSCGTGVTASVLAAAATGRIKNQMECNVISLGGRLIVKYAKSGNGFSNIYLNGPAIFVYEGDIEL